MDTRGNQSGSAEPPDLEVGLEALRRSSEFQGPVEPVGDHDHANDHLALIYDDRDEQLSAAVPFVRQGLERGERCLYVVDENSREEILAAMREGGIDVDAALESGALAVHSKQDTYMKDGSFDPQDMVEFLEDAIDDATEEFEALRIAGEMTWILGESPEIESLIEYEAELNRLFPDEDIIALCQYNRERFAAETIREVIRTHPHLIFDGKVCQNVYYTPPEEFFGPDQPGNEVDRMMRTLRDRTEAKVELSDQQRFLQEMNEVTSSPDLSFEEKLQALFDLGCERFGLDLGALNRVDPHLDRLRVEHVSGPHDHFQPGVELPLSQTYCRAAVDIKDAAAVSDPPKEGFDGIEVYQDFGVQAYLGTYIPIEGGTDRTFAFVSSERPADPFSEEDRTYLELMGQWVKYELERKGREQSQQRLYDIAADAERSFGEKLDDLFDLGCERFDLDLGGMARIDPGSDHFEVEAVSGDHEQLEPGAELALSETYCRVLDDDEVTVGITDPVDDGLDGLQAYSEFGVRSYIGTRIEVEDGFDRTLFFVSEDPRETEFSEFERTFLHLLGQWVKYELEREQREAELQRSKEQFERIFENSQDAIFIVDPLADELLEANPAGCEMLDYSREELLARGPSDLHPDEMDRFRAFVDEVYENGAGWTDELTCRHREGWDIPAEISASKLEYDGRDCMLAMVRDITDRKERERELEQAERQFEAVFNNPVSFVGLLDPDGTVRRINENALDFVGVDESEVRGEKFWKTPWFTHSGKVQEQLRDGIARAAEGEYVRAEIPHQSQDGETAILDAMLEPVLDDDGDVVAIVPSGHDITELRERERFQRRLYETVADPDRPFEEKLQAMLDLGCERFDMEIGGIATVDEDTDRFEVDVTNADHEHLAPGEQYPLSETYCDEVAREEGTSAVTDPERFVGKLCYDRFGIRTYLGTYLEFDRAADRTFWFVSEEPREEFTEAERTFHHLMGQWVQYELERQHTTDKLAALNRLNEVARDVNRKLAQQSTREDIEAVVCDRLAESDSYEFAWVGVAEGDTVVPSTCASTGADIDGIPVCGSNHAEQGAADEAHRTGDPQVVKNIEGPSAYEPWREHARDRDIAASAAIPIAYEGQCYGVLNVYTSREHAFDDEEQEVVEQLGEIMGLAITAIEREQELEHERERLAFINSLLRHNLLNDLSIIHARAGILDPHVDEEGGQHLDVVRNHAEEMADLIETLRSLTQGLIEADHDPGPTDLGAVLREEVEQASLAAEDAVFDVPANLDDAPTVIADGLLGEAFQNLLVNAVQHNDKDVPRVRVDVESSEETVTVQVADNGPGVPETIGDRIFEKGEKGLDSRGTGYGLHLVREIVDLYDGEVSVENTDPEGAVFSVTLPRA